MVRHLWRQATLELLVMVGLLVGGAGPGHAWNRLGGMGGGGHAGVVSPHGFGGSRVFVSNRAFFGSHVFVNNRVFVGSRVFVVPRACCFGPRVFFSAGVGLPFWYPFPYPYPYPVYSPPAYVQPDPPYQPQYWYYCSSARGYYPYVKECPDGWLQVVPQPPSL